MELKIQLSGIASEISGKEMIIIELENYDDFHNTLTKYIPGLINCSYRISINGSLTDDLSGIFQADEILLFSPIAGG